MRHVFMLTASTFHGLETVFFRGLRRVNMDEELLGAPLQEVVQRLIAASQLRQLSDYINPVHKVSARFTKSEAALKHFERV